MDWTKTLTAVGLLGAGALAGSALLTEAKAEAVDVPAEACAILVAAHGGTCREHVDAAVARMVEAAGAALKAKKLEAYDKLDKAKRAQVDALLSAKP